MIKAFNEDKPYNQFIIEQLAGDELDKSDSYDALTATASSALDPGFAIATGKSQLIGYDYMDDMVRTTIQGFQALTINCARCHDHKFDPITRMDYYKTVAIFNSAVEYDQPLVPDDRVDAYIRKDSNELNAKIKDA